MQAAATANVAACIAITQPPPAVATTMPATVGPSTRVALRVVASTELACFRAGRATSCGTIPRSAGRVKAVSAPPSASSTTTAPRW